MFRTRCPCNLTIAQRRRRTRARKSITFTLGVRADFGASRFLTAPPDKRCAQSAQSLAFRLFGARAIPCAEGREVLRPADSSALPCNSGRGAIVDCTSRRLPSTSRRMLLMTSSSDRGGMSTQFKLACENGHVAEFVYGGDCGGLSAAGKSSCASRRVRGATLPIVGRIHGNSALIYFNARNRNAGERMLFRL